MVESGYYEANININGSLREFFKLLQPVCFSSYLLHKALNSQ